MKLFLKIIKNKFEMTDIDLNSQKFHKIRILLIIVQIILGSAFFMAILLKNNSLGYIFYGFSVLPTNLFFLGEIILYFCVSDFSYVNLDPHELNNRYWQYLRVGTLALNTSLLIWWFLTTTNLIFLFIWILTIFAILMELNQSCHQYDDYSRYCHCGCSEPYVTTV